jgi:hypothetical protein
MDEAISDAKSHNGARYAQWASGTASVSLLHQSGFFLFCRGSFWVEMWSCSPGAILVQGTLYLHTYCRSLSRPALSFFRGTLHPCRRSSSTCPSTTPSCLSRRQSGVALQPKPNKRSADTLRVQRPTSIRHSRVIDSDCINYAIRPCVLEDPWVLADRL